MVYLSEFGFTIFMFAKYPKHDTIYITCRVVFPLNESFIHLAEDHIHKVEVCSLEMDQTLHSLDVTVKLKGTTIKNSFYNYQFNLNLVLHSCIYHRVFRVLIYRPDKVKYR